MSLRGKKVYTLFGPEEEEITDPQDQRGRNPELIELRDEHMLYRYNYYRGDIRNSYEWIVKQLCNEFYLSASTVGQKIANNESLLARIYRENMTAAQLNKRYPFFKW